jgi:protein SCO1/2
MGLTACARGPAAPDIALDSDAGVPWQLAAQRGNAVILTFGYTHCADTCPVTVARLARLMQRIGPSGNRVEIAFITIDPKRDTPHALHAFLSRFEPTPAHLVGLTGTTAQIDAVENAYHAYARGETHSTFIFFIDRSGHTIGVHDDGDSDAVLAQAAREALS